MKLLVVGPDIRDLRRVKNFTGVYAFYLMRELRKRGVDLYFVDGKNKNPQKYLAEIDGADCDHALALGLRWFTHQPEGCATILKTKVPGAVTQLHDGLIHDYLVPWMANVDCTFTFRDDSTRTRDWARYAQRYHYIGWAADPELLYPEQTTSELRILLDHPFYKSGQPDITEAVTVDATMFGHCSLWRGKPIKVRRLVNGGAEDVTIHDAPLKVFERVHVPFPRYRARVSQDACLLRDAQGIGWPDVLGAGLLRRVGCGAQGHDLPRSAGDRSPYRIRGRARTMGPDH